MIVEAIAESATLRKLRSVGISFTVSLRYDATHAEWFRPFITIDTPHKPWTKDQKKALKSIEQDVHFQVAHRIRRNRK